MTYLSAQIKRMNEKLQQLLKNHQALQKENERQKAQIKELQEKQSSLTAHAATLEQQVAILKAAAGEMNPADKRNFEKHISQYIKEIDKCIALLTE